MASATPDLRLPSQPQAAIGRLRVRTKVYSAFHPSGVGKWVPASAGKAKAGLIPIADERVGVQVKLWYPLRTRAIPERFCGDSLRRGAISSVCTFTFTAMGLKN